MVKLRTIWKLLDDFYSHVDARSITLLVVKNGYSKILQWHFKIWQKRYKHKEGFVEVSIKLESIIRRIEERALRENESDFLFDKLKEHISSCSKEKIIKDGRERYYIENLLRIFYSVFFRVMEDIEDFSKQKISMVQLS